MRIRKSLSGKALLAWAASCAARLHPEAAGRLSLHVVSMWDITAALV
ncbi:hypothetical protein [Longimicrobium sp.]